MKGFVRLPLYRVICLAEADFVKGREQGALRPTSELGHWWWVRKGSRVLRLINTAYFRIYIKPRMQLRAVQRRKRQARARTGRRR